jgi:hypothetical protein
MKQLLTLGFLICTNGLLLGAAEKPKAETQEQKKVQAVTAVNVAASFAIEDLQEEADGGNVASAKALSDLREKINNPQYKISLASEKILQDAKLIQYNRVHEGAILAFRKYAK